MAIRDIIPWRRTERRLPVRYEEEPLFSLQREVNRLFDDFFRGFRLTPFRAFDDDFWGTFSPRVDITEDDKTVTVVAEVPGVDEKDLDIMVREDELILKGEKRVEHEEKGRDHYHVERSFGAFQRVIPLPCEVVADKAEARLKNGVLTITLPKSEEARRTGRRIEIKAA